MRWRISHPPSCYAMQSQLLRSVMLCNRTFRPVIAYTLKRYCIQLTSSLDSWLVLQQMPINSEMNESRQCLYRQKSPFLVTACPLVTCSNGLMTVSLVMSMITRKGTIVRKTRLSRAHQSVRRPVTGSLRGGHFGTITGKTGAYCSGTSIHQTSTSSTVPSLQYGRQSIGSSQHPNCSNSDQQTLSSRPSLFNTLVQLKVEFYLFIYDCSYYCFIRLLEIIN